MHIWFPHEYPRAPPMVFVVPTKDMGVRKGREVEPGGRVREEALHEAWARKKDLDGVVAWLTEVFSAVPPVYAKPAERRVAPAAGVPGQTGNGAVMNGMGAGAGAGAPVQPPAPVQGQAPAPSLPARPHYAPPNDEVCPTGCCCC
jgi:ESCRT-I complex subunit TSG101